MNPLVKELEEQGLEIAEEAVEKIVKAVFKIAKQAIPVQFTLIIPIINKIEEYVLKYVDKIDGQEDA